MPFFIFDYLQHRRDCKFKQQERADRIRALPSSYHGPISVVDRDIINRPIADLVKAVQDGQLRPTTVLTTYGKVAVRAHEKTTCLTEVMISSAEGWLTDGSVNLKGPLAGIPVSLKDTIDVAGYDSTVGYSRNVGNKLPVDGPMTRLLKDAGAVPYVKTNCPITLLSFESTNDVWGRCTNPHNKAYSPGGSTGGEGALLALGGRIGVGSDVAGSVRAPAHYSGIYALRCATGRWPKVGVHTSMPGQEGVPAVYSPMARTLDDLRYFTRAVVGMQPWKYDYSIHPLPWRPEVEDEYKTKKLRVGVMRTDGVVDPSPACRAGLEKVEAALRAQGHDIVEVNPPSPFEGLRLASLLLNADGCQMFKSFFRWGEWEDRGARQMSFLMGLPRPFKYIYYLWVRYVRRDPIWAALVKDWHPKSAYENWQLVAKRELYRREWFDWWDGEKLDCLITVPNATPACPHDGMEDSVSNCGYTFLFNLLDYTSGVLPVKRVEKALDRLDARFDMRKLNGVAKGAYASYDAEAMHGLPVGVQVVGRRLEEEKVLTIMQRIEDALGEDKYQLLEVD